MGLSELLTCISEGWSPKIGDPTIMGWVTVAAYVVTAALSARAGTRHEGRLSLFWFGCAVLMCCLAVNKELDLQSALTQAGRCLSKAQGWYGARRSVQIAFIMSMIAGGVLIALVLSWAMRREFSRIWLAVLGLAFLLAFILIRAAGFHDFDRVIGRRIGTIRMNWIMEIGGIALICLNAITASARRNVTSRT